MISLPGTMTKRSSRTGAGVDAAEAHDHGAQRAIVHVDGAGPGDTARVDAERVAVMHVVVEHRGQEVVRRGDGVEIPGEVEVDLVHGDDLGVAAAGGAPLHAEHGPEGRLANADDDLLAEAAQSLGDADGDGALALAGGGRVDAGDEDESAGGLPLRDGLGGDLRLGLAVRQDLVGGEADFGGHVGDGAHLLLRGLGDFDI